MRVSLSASTLHSPSSTVALGDGVTLESGAQRTDPKTRRLDRRGAGERHAFVSVRERELFAHLMRLEVVQGAGRERVTDDERVRGARVVDDRLADGRHTWEAYHLSLRNLIFEFDWSRVLSTSVPVTIFHGTDVPIGDQAYIAEIDGSSNSWTSPGQITMLLSSIRNCSSRHSTNGRQQPARL